MDRRYNLEIVVVVPCRDNHLMIAKLGKYISSWDWKSRKERERPHKYIVLEKGTGHFYYEGP